MADATATANATLTVTVVVCLGPRETREWTVQLPAPATVRDALQACVDPPAIPLLPGQEAPEGGWPPVGIWGQVATVDAAVRNLDRVEVYRPLTVDPKVARRERFARQGARTTGLFARRRPGGKSGY